MPDAITEMKAELDKINARLCTCIPCIDCGGTGNIRVDMFTGGPDPGDDLYDLETCGQCEGGIVEVCERCREAEEVSELIDEERERQLRQRQHQVELH